MMLTRCPACQTVFRLHPEQIRARNGEVRCGHCFNPFNALQHLVAPPDDAADAKEADQQPAGFDPANVDDREPTPVAAAHQPVPPPPADDALDFELPEFPPFDDARTDAGPPPGEAGFARSTASGQPEAGHPLAPATADRDAVPGETAPDESAPGSALPEVIRSARRSTPEADDGDSTSAAIDTAAAEDAAQPEPAPALAGQPPDTATGDGSAAAEAGPDLPPAARHVDLEHLDATYGRPRSRRSAVMRTLAGMAAGLLAGMLAAQATYLFRTEITRALPGMRPLFEAGCAALGCEVPLPQDVALIGIETSDLQSDPGHAGRYVLFATVKNRADYPQGWPHLELTLTDATDTPVVRRVLAPADWVPASEPKAGMSARATIPVRLPFRLEGASPTGYRVYVFYP